MQNKMTLRPSRTCCKFCGVKFTDDDDSEVTYKDGSAAHDSCHDAEEFRRENAADLRD